MSLVVCTIHAIKSAKKLAENQKSGEKSEKSLHCGQEVSRAEKSAKPRSRPKNHCGCSHEEKDDVSFYAQPSVAADYGVLTNLVGKVA